MPAKSKNQQKLMGMALHHPEMVSKKNRGVMKMERSEMRKMAATKHKGLPMRKG